MKAGDTVKFVGENTFVLYGRPPYGIVSEYKEDEPDIVYVRWGMGGYSSRTACKDVEVIESNPFSVGDVVLKEDKIFLVEEVDGIFVGLDNGGGRIAFPDLEKVAEDAAIEWRTLLMLGNALRQYAAEGGWCGDYEESIIDASGTDAFADRARRVKCFDVSIRPFSIGADPRTDIKMRIRAALNREFSGPGESGSLVTVEVVGEVD